MKVEFIWKKVVIKVNPVDKDSTNVSKEYELDFH